METKAILILGGCGIGTAITERIAAMASMKNDVVCLIGFPVSGPTSEPLTLSIEEADLYFSDYEKAILTSFEISEEERQARYAEMLEAMERNRIELEPLPKFADYKYGFEYKEDFSNRKNIHYNGYSKRLSTKKPQGRIYKAGRHHKARY